MLASKWIDKQTLKCKILLLVLNLNRFLSSHKIDGKSDNPERKFSGESGCAKDIGADYAAEELLDSRSADFSKGEDIYFPRSDHDCSRIFEDSVYASEKQKASRSLHSVLQTFAPLILDSSADAAVDASCETIRNRVLAYLVPTTKMESDFPIAFVRIVYKDYRLQELLFKLQYAHQNLFCFVIDKKATALFKEQMKNLTECFPNVILAGRQLDVDSAGHNMLSGFLDCLRLLLARPMWKYAITLQNHDIPLRTNFELVNVLRALNGSNDVGVMHTIRDRIPKNNSFTYKSLRLFKDNSKNDNRPLYITKGSSSCSLSRAFVDFIVNKLNVSIFVELFNKMYYGVDEMLFSTLHSNDDLGNKGAILPKKTVASVDVRMVIMVFLRVLQEC
ncbi:unnamed protein product [Toxocara canis]|uniref:Uncharacterized protein n=1 Tax=Toxocara canis TaxID=6265 RepID=A0A183VB34_TOXCA|nr:unnamed protein product [Toxocara canis]